jgi:hypothetical protein
MMARCAIISSLTSLRAAALFLIAILTTQQQQHLVNAQTTTASTTTTTTTTTPPLWSKTGCPPTWIANSPLSSDSIVSLNSIVYQCKEGQQMGVVWGHYNLHKNLHGLLRQEVLRGLRNSGCTTSTTADAADVSLLAAESSGRRVDGNA